MENNAFFSYSSIHLNFWCGNFSKYQGMKHFISKYRPGYSLENSLYFGDAPNDQEVFRYHSRSIGVSNIKNYLKEMKYLPQIILEGKENRGPYGVFNYLSSELK